MARLGRAHPSRPLLTRKRVQVFRVVTLPVFETVDEFPPLVTAVPGANIYLPVFEAADEFPPLVLSYEQRYALPVFETADEFPELVVDVPIRAGQAITAAGQAELNGTVWGAGTDVRVLLPVEGWRSTPQLINLNVERPNRHGAWAARTLSQQRLVTLRLQPNSASDPTLIDDLLDAIDQVAYIGADETPISLVIRPYGAAQLVLGKVIDRHVDLDGDYNAGLPTVSVLFACADPRRYNIDRTGISISVSQTVQVINAGNTETHPLVRIPGPVTNPRISNGATGRLLAFSLSLDAGEQLVIDTDNGTATVDGDNVTSSLTGSSAPVDGWVLTRGANAITYTATSGGDELTLLYRDAWI